MKNDSLGDRMKNDYELRQKVYLSRRTYTMMRFDGKAFHTYTKGLQRPFDLDFIEDMDLAAAHLCKNIMGAQFAFVQSDEITILLTDFETQSKQAWFDYEVQKMCSVGASMAANGFNKSRLNRIKDLEKFKFAEFDARVWQMGLRVEVENNFIWRQQDATRNSIQSAAQNEFSQKELHGKNTNVLQEMLFNKGINWNDYPAGCKRGRIIIKQNFEHIGKNGENSARSKWVSVEPPVFTQEREWLRNLIPDKSLTELPNFN